MIIIYTEAHGEYSFYSTYDSLFSADTIRKKIRRITVGVEAASSAIESTVKILQQAGIWKDLEVTSNKKSISFTGDLSNRCHILIALSIFFYTLPEHATGVLPQELLYEFKIFEALDRLEIAGIETEPHLYKLGSSSILRSSISSMFSLVDFAEARTALLFIGVPYLREEYQINTAMTPVDVLQYLVYKYFKGRTDLKDTTLQSFKSMLPNNNITYNIVSSLAVPLRKYRLSPMLSTFDNSGDFSPINSVDTALSIWTVLKQEEEVTK